MKVGYSTVEEFREGLRERILDVLDEYPAESKVNPDFEARLREPAGSDDPGVSNEEATRQPGIEL